ncbi:NAD(P)H-quinone oxidoreductase [Mangrovibrevibacter kandeliae]|uniref:NAD(P)H-quinone oxidoreductase n=1 Tax=Mangrovibrevibacter kandeliae TaxID=2968473 RepID=UPI002117977E|nr:MULTISPECIES: NAD(P)H-quinone oxidoreductase [unclassified Aurantimonas]MCQ8783239.1 NAD(P)H-quinone oxidoreductase [Aurantimonas sp. CSK15Z-1]MCW4116246.1 NAD(P)H-quinone oxidoreductase [Aurantimonas sp. MSK8Z-1]
MKAAVLDGFGGPEVLTLAERPVPVPTAGEVLIEVLAAGVNRPDVLQRLGHYPPPPGAPDWPGLEVAGRVVGRGTDAGRYREGDLVTALVSGGGYAQFCTAPEGSVLPIPAGLDPVAAAALPETVFTVWHNLFQRGGLKEGETVLVHGGTSGIGTMAIQLACAFGATVFTTAGSAAKCAAAERLGAAKAFDYRRMDFVAAVRDATDGRGVDLILDMVGGDYVQRNLVAAAEDGRIVQIAHLSGNRVELDIGLVMRKRLTVTGSTLRNRPAAVKAAIAREVEAKAWPLVAQGRVRPLIEATYPLEQAGDAHRHIERDHIGKIVLSM